MPVVVYAESTPNPNILKFVLNKKLTDKSVEYLSPSEAINAPLARLLFDFDFIKSDFIASNFISITKSGAYDWYELMPQIRETIIRFFNEGNSPFAQEETGKKTEEIKKLPPIDNQIINLIEEFVQPAVEGDGGEIVFKSFEKGKVTLIMKGACRGCPSSTITLKSGIENLLKQMIPDVKEVVAEAAV